MPHTHTFDGEVFGKPYCSDCEETVDPMDLPEETDERPDPEPEEKDDKK